MGFMGDHGREWRRTGSLSEPKNGDLLGIGEETSGREGKPAFLGAPIERDWNRIAEYDAAIVGAPFDLGHSVRTGTRLGPLAIRKVSELYQPFHYRTGIDLRERLRLCDIGDMAVCDSVQTSFDTITDAVSRLMRCGTMPIILGGDHSIGYPCIRGIAENVEGNVGIIHLDRHLNIEASERDERMHTTPWFHATHIPNAPPGNLVQIGIGTWQVPHAGIHVSEERGTNVLTIHDVDELGIEKVAEMALEIAWKGASAVYLSFDLDSVDSGFAPGARGAEPGGFLPREALRLMELVAREGLVGMEVAHVAPSCDLGDQTALLAARAILDVLATMLHHNKLGGGKHAHSGRISGR
ncbi:agmatinase [Cohnella sp. AR92]|nr:agmatinase [Cohnella sp. AR92]